MLGSLSNVVTSVDNIEYQHVLSDDQNSLRSAGNVSDFKNFPRGVSVCPQTTGYVMPGSHNSI